MLKKKFELLDAMLNMAQIEAQAAKLTSSKRAGESADSLSIEVERVKDALPGVGDEKAISIAVRRLSLTVPATDRSVVVGGAKKILGKSLNFLGFSGHVLENEGEETLSVAARKSIGEVSLRLRERKEEHMKVLSKAENAPALAVLLKDLDAKAVDLGLGRSFDKPLIPDEGDGEIPLAYQVKILEAVKGDLRKARNPKGSSTKKDGVVAPNNLNKLLGR
jgi:hypothetical protein